MDGGALGGTSVKPRALLFRSELLPLSETFIAAQARAMRRYEPRFLGLRRLPSSLVLPGQSICAGDRLPGEQWLFQATHCAPALALAARSQHAALLHAHFAIDAAELLPLRRRLALPLIVTLHGYDVMRSDAAHRTTLPGRRYLRRRTRLWDEAEVFLCVSKAIQEEAIARGYPARKLRVLPIGVDTEQLQFQLRLPSSPLVLFVGRLVPKKGCHLLIRAMARLQQRLPEARLRVIGDGPQRAALEQAAAAQTTGTRFLGALGAEQVRVEMLEARCLAAPSLRAADGDGEGLPMVLCEALALGVPVVSTRHSGIPELITHGVDGLLSAEGDEEALAANLLAMLSGRCNVEKLRAAGRSQVERDFALCRQTAALEECYDEFAAPVRPPVRHGAEAPVGRRDKFDGLNEPSAVGSCAPEATNRLVAPAGQRSPSGPSRLRHQSAWLLSGNGAAMLFQAITFLLVGRLLGSAEYGALVGMVALVNVLSQFSSLGMDMVLLRTIARDREDFPAVWGRALLVTVCGFTVLLTGVYLYGRVFLSPTLATLLPYLACSDALFGKVTQLASRALQGADLPRWSAQLAALTSFARAAAAALLAAGISLLSTPRHQAVHALVWVRTYCAVSLLVAGISVVLVTRLLGRPRWTPVRRSHFMEGLSFCCSSSAISVYNDIDKTMLLFYGMTAAAGVYGSAYRVIDVVSVPVLSLFAAASPRLFRAGAGGGPQGAAQGAARLLRWTVPFGVLAAPALALSAPLLPWLFGPSFQGSTSVLRWLCLLPLLRGLHYAWGTAITACGTQWPRTGAQLAAALLNILLNLVLIPRFGWRGAALASLVTDGALSLFSYVILRTLVIRQQQPRRRTESRPQEAAPLC